MSRIAIYPHEREPQPSNCQEFCQGRSLCSYEFMCKDAAKQQYDLETPEPVVEFYAQSEENWMDSSGYVKGEREDYRRYDSYGDL